MKGNVQLEKHGVEFHQASSPKRIDFSRKLPTIESAASAVLFEKGKRGTEVVFRRAIDLGLRIRRVNPCQGRSELMLQA